MMAITTVLEKQTLTGFADSGDSVSYMYANSTELSPFEIGRYYVVFWEDSEYRCLAKEVSGVSALGNEGIFGGTETAEPFLIGILTAENTDLDANTLMKCTAEGPVGEFCLHGCENNACKSAPACTVACKNANTLVQ